MRGRLESETRVARWVRDPGSEARAQLLCETGPVLFEERIVLRRRGTSLAVGFKLAMQLREGIIVTLFLRWRMSQTLNGADKEDTRACYVIWTLPGSNEN